MFAGRYIEKICSRGWYAMVLCRLPVRDLLMRSRGQLDHVLLPQPAKLATLVVLIFREPQFTLLRDDVEDLALDVREVRVAALLANLVNVELKQRGADEEDVCGLSGG